MSKHKPGSKDEYATEADTAELLQASKLPEPLRYADALEKTMQWPLHGKAADCLRKLHGELEAMKAARPVRPSPVQEAVAWPCLIEEADFSQNTVTLAMQCEDYKVSAGKHWLYTTPPAEAQQEPVGVVHHKPSNVFGADYEQVAVFTRVLEPGAKLYDTPPAAQTAPAQKPLAWADEIIADLHALYDSKMITENDSGDALIRLDAAICAVEEAEERHTTPPAAAQPAPVQGPVALEAVYETIIQWDEGGGKRSRRELARRIVALYTTPSAQEFVCSTGLCHYKAQRQQIAAEREAFPNLEPVITWLESGCDPKQAAKELRIYAAAIRARRQE